MQKWPGWSAPLLGLLGGAFAGLSLAGDPRSRFLAWQSALGGAAAGLFAGLLIWAYDVIQPNRKFPEIELDATPTKSSRWQGLFILAIGLTCLAINHAVVLLTDKKYLALVLGGGFFSGLGLAGIAVPRLLNRYSSEAKLRWWEHTIGGVLVLAGIAFHFYLWIVVY